MLSRAAVVIGFLIFCLSGQHAMAGKRVALVIGNSAYQNITPLPNPLRDAAAVADMFRKAGFDIVESRSEPQEYETRRALNSFFDSARDADMAVVYYAGHGIEIDGSNYIIPVDAVLDRDRDVYDEAVTLDRVVQSIEPARQLRLVILDACRDNPFAKNMRRTLASRGVTRGLLGSIPMNPNTLIAFAAKAGTTADDGAGAHSPFTTSLLKHLTVPGLDLRRAFGLIRDDVMSSTSNRQEPFVFGSLGGADVSLVPAAVAPPAQDVAAEVRREYEFAERVGTKEAWDYFLQAHRSGFYADLAKAQRNKLAAEEARMIATEQAKTAIDEQIRLAVEGALASEQAKAAAKTKATEETRLAAERASEQAKIVIAAQTATPGKVASLTDSVPATPSPPQDAKIPNLPPNVSVPGREPSSKEALDWDKVKDTTDPSALQNFIQRYPNSPLSINAHDGSMSLSAQRTSAKKRLAPIGRLRRRLQRKLGSRLNRKRPRLPLRKSAKTTSVVQRPRKRNRRPKLQRPKKKAAEAKQRAEEAEKIKAAAEEARLQAERRQAEITAAKQREDDERRAKAAEAEQAKAAEAERKAAEAKQKAEEAQKIKATAEEARLQAEKKKAELAAAKKREDDERRAKAAEAEQAAKALAAEKKAAEEKQEDRRG